jgi:hypothetical protein
MYPNPKSSRVQASCKPKKKKKERKNLWTRMEDQLLLSSSPITSPIITK